MSESLPDQDERLLRERIATALSGSGKPSIHDYRYADLVLAGIGLGDYGAAVDRAARALMDTPKDMVSAEPYTTLKFVLAAFFDQLSKGPESAS